MPEIKSFQLDKTIIAERIYRDCRHLTSTTGGVFDEYESRELEQFLTAFRNFIKIDYQFMRLDIFLGDQNLYIIEINVELQDGWGVALNLLRASGKTIRAKGECFPREIIAYSEDYVPEFELAQKELANLGQKMEVVSWRERLGVMAKSPFDDKIYLARFSKIWEGLLIKIPRTYWIENTTWEDLPEDVVFKFRQKYGEQAKRAGYSARHRSDLGKGKFIRQCYFNGSVIAQEYIKPGQTIDGQVTQAIVMCAGNIPVTGYLQTAPPGTFIINDRTAAKGPLELL